MLGFQNVYGIGIWYKNNVQCPNQKETSLQAMTAIADAHPLLMRRVSFLMTVN